ncbi:MAG: hypothetical protein ACFBZ8_03925 [Opitutales bacterium]
MTTTFAQPSLVPAQFEYAPLDTLTLKLPAEISTAAKSLSVFDAAGRTYFEASLSDDSEVAFRVSGALGTHTCLLLDATQSVVGLTTFRTNCQTRIDDEGGRFSRLFDMLFDTMMLDWFGGGDKVLRINGKVYRYYVSWIRDHVHALKGMKYFDDQVKTGIELYADSQREDGMIWDKCKKMLHSDLQNYRDYEFAEGDFIRPIPGNPQRRWQRIPVENDVEYLFLEGLYYAWKACGDTQWMSGLLDNAIKAVRYATTDRYRWSEKFQLLKRGFTIDTWDFQHVDDVKRTGTTIMRVSPDKTVFGVMHGDNTGMAVGCYYLSEMLEAAGRTDEARTYRELGDTLYQRLIDLAWNGDFFTHHISEDPSFKRDIGQTDESKQVTQSNAYALNRRLPHAHCAKILRTYQQLRHEMPPSSAGEFYSCWPPFEKGFGQHKPGDYMNGGVTTICAGELAHGAFEHGFEVYGADVLTRITDWCEKLGGYLHCCLKGVMPEPPARAFTTVDLRPVANADFHGDGAEGVPGWIGGGNNDMSGLPTGPQTFADVAFDIIDPSANGRCAALILGHQERFQPKATIPVGAKAHSLYLLHAHSGSPPNGFVGTLRLVYADGSESIQYIHDNAQSRSWFMPAPNDPYSGGNQKRGPVNLRLGWQGPNRQFENVGLHVFGMNNPKPDAVIESVHLEVAQADVNWMLGALTLCDAPVYFVPSQVSYGIPDIWGAGALMYALIEGLAGIVDTGVAFDQIRLAPRWSAAGVNRAKAAAVMHASGGYVSYSYAWDSGIKALELDFASNAERTDLRLLLPEGVESGSATVNGEACEAAFERVENSTYAMLPLEGVKAWAIRFTAD